MNNFVLVSWVGATAVVQLNRPEKRNALSLAMRKQLSEVLDACISDTQCRAIILTGTGKAFCSGGDIGEMRDGPNRSDTERRHRLSLLQGISRNILFAPKPVIAAVNGAAFGAGLSFVSACDGVVAVEGAEFSAAFSRVGLFPDAGIMWTLPQRISHAAARRLLMTGERIGAVEAQRLGLVDHLVAPDELLTAAHKLAGSYQHASTGALSSIKRAMAVLPATLDDLFNHEAEMQLALGDSQESKEAKAAFFEKRTSTLSED
jgi:2-(1,2-epoxy-1,2-dihydrophenyl)acetyl-CoA isomerase